MKRAKTIRSLNGEWNYFADSSNKLTYELIIQKLKKKNLRKIKIPVNWEAAGMHNFSGTIWFALKFNLRSALNDLKILEFRGVDYFADVWVNNSYIGHHEGYFQSFYFDTSNVVISGENLLVVKVNSPKEKPGEVWPDKKKLIKGIFNHHDCRPGGKSFEYGQDQNTGGIWNDVLLYSVDKIFVESVLVYPRIDFNKNKAVIKVSLFSYKKNNTILKDTLEFNFISASGRKNKFRKEIQLKKTKNKSDFEFEISNPELWWSWDTGRTDVYKLSILGKYINVENVIFGIREVKLNDREEFFLNNKKVFLRGTNIIPAQLLSELSNKKINKQVSLVKEANINIIRMHAHINRSEYYEECDKQGIMVWQDFALQWTYDESAEFISNACSQIKDMINLLYNHPSIAFWCCHNEPGRQIESLDPFLYKSVSKLDSNRIIRKASNYEEHAYDGWYWGNKEHFISRPMGPLVTEFGAQAIPQLESLKKIIPEKDIYKPDRSIWAYHNFQFEQTFKVAEVSFGSSIDDFIENSQNYQGALLTTAIDFYRRGKNKDITGIFQFMFIDCWPSITWSVIDFYGKKKKGYFAMQKAFQPVYVSVFVRQKKFSAGQKLELDYWVINDKPEEILSCKLIFMVRKEKLVEIHFASIGGDSIVKFNGDANDIKLPDNLRTGKYNIDVLLFHNNGILSKNDFEIEIV
ncbi:MAG TPA: glycoside hydrolase family 2 TIM barrel-domain containing protein [Ignavibacteriaceae bacterium]|nr:glycoside hydrolase family 2 TIM barrel-domain containing protein [Ignavibacteriaceae bacterium]